MARSKRFRGVGVAHRRLEVDGGVRLGIEDRNIVHAVFGRAEHRTIVIDGRIAAIRRDQIVEILLLVRPVPGGDHHIALEAGRPRRLGMGQFALGDPISPVAEILVGRAAELAGQDIHHELARLARLGATNPGLFTRLEVTERLRDRAGGRLPELMTAYAAVVFHQVEPVVLPDVARNIA